MGGQLYAYTHITCNTYYTRSQGNRLCGPKLFETWLRTIQAMPAAPECWVTEFSAMDSKRALQCDTRGDYCDAIVRSDLWISDQACLFLQRLRSEERRVG